MSMSKTAAKRQAHHESYMYRQGTGWSVSTWDDFYGMMTTTDNLPYGIARHALAEYRRNRVATLIHNYPLRPRYMPRSIND